MITENITLLEFVNKHFKHYDIIYKKEKYDSLEIRVKGAKTGKTIIRKTNPYALINVPRHKKYQEINVQDRFELEIYNEKTLDGNLIIKPYILLWSSGR